eukprot:Phypoly_transcript_10110.p1 GENE.Phypoly_transcript_10110~~Phypoly_transcript_10110.p1  ORF type:complete len:385 (+),score=76.53 Phypoly_transcript_10110:94-1248(+)
MDRKEQRMIKRHVPPDADPSCRIVRREKEGVDPKPAEIPSLVHLTSQWIRDRLHLSSVSVLVAQVPDELLEVLLDGCTPDQLSKIEFHAQRDLSQVTEVVWRTHCRTFLNNKDLDDKDGHSSWKEYYQHLQVEYENKKLQTGKHLRSLYDEQAKEKASKKIKILDSAPVARARSTFGTTFTGYNKPVSKSMEKCLKDARKTQAMQWRKPPGQPPIKVQKTVTTILPKHTTLLPPKLAANPGPPNNSTNPKSLPAKPATKPPPLTTTSRPNLTPINKQNSMAAHKPLQPSTKPTTLSTKPSAPPPKSLPSQKSTPSNSNEAHFALPHFYKAKNPTPNLQNQGTSKISTTKSLPSKPLPQNTSSKSLTPHAKPSLSQKPVLRPKTG